MREKHLVINFKLMLTLLSISILTNNSLASTDSQKFIDECVRCHIENEIMPEHYSIDDIHWQVGLSCSGCHGGLPNEKDEQLAMSKENGFIGIPDKKDIPKFCGKCHSNIEKMRLFQARISTDQVSQYYSSLHGQKLKKEDLQVATCTDCHSTHSILPASDTRSTVNAFKIPSTCNNCHGDAKLMGKYNLKHTQYEDYSKSVHGMALLENRDNGAPACNDCHGNHGAKPPGVESISHVCGSCHINNMNYFNDSPKAQIFSEMDINACEQCHGYHLIQKADDEMLNVTSSSTCSDCHSKGDEGYIAADMMYLEIRKLSSLFDSIKAKSDEINIMGMNNIEIEYELKNIWQNLIHARTLIHTFDTSKVFEKTKQGINASFDALRLADQEETDYSERRLGYGIATLILILLAITLFWKIKSLNS